MPHSDQERTAKRVFQMSLAGTLRLIVKGSLSPRTRQLLCLHEALRRKPERCPAISCNLLERQRRRQNKTPCEKFLTTCVGRCPSDKQDLRIGDLQTAASMFRSQRVRNLEKCFCGDTGCKTLSRNRRYSSASYRASSLAWLRRG